MYESTNILNSRASVWCAHASFPGNRSISEFCQLHRDGDPLCYCVYDSMNFPGFRSSVQCAHVSCNATQAKRTLIFANCTDARRCVGAPRQFATHADSCAVHVSYQHHSSIGCILMLFFRFSKCEICIPKCCVRPCILHMFG